MTMNLIKSPLFSQVNLSLSLAQQRE